MQMVGLFPLTTARMEEESWSLQLPTGNQQPGAGGRSKVLGGGGLCSYCPGRAARSFFSRQGTLKLGWAGCAESCLGWKLLLMPACLQPGANSNVGNMETAHLGSRPANDYGRNLVDSRDRENNSSPFYIMLPCSQTAPWKLRAKFQEVGSLPQETRNLRVSEPFGMLLLQWMTQWLRVHSSVRKNT